MKTTRKIALLSKTLLFALTLFVSQTYAQEYSLNNATSELTVFGTSNLHDWDVKAEKQSGKLALDRSGQLQIKLLQVSVETRSEEHTSELQSRPHLVCRLLLEKKN